MQLRIIDGQRERRDRVIRLDGKELTIGRASQGQRPGPGELLFKEPTVSRVHATLTWKPLKGGFQLVHKSKTNPTLVNGKPTKKILLAPGDRMQMGLLILELEEDPSGRTASSSRSSRSSMTEPIMEALSKVEREHEEDRRRTRAEREEKQRQREILASPDSGAGYSGGQKRSSSRLDEALRSAPYAPQEEEKKRRRSSGFGWQPPEEREEEKSWGWGSGAKADSGSGAKPESGGAAGWGSAEGSEVKSGSESTDWGWGSKSGGSSKGWEERSKAGPEARAEQPKQGVDVSYEPPTTQSRRTIPITSVEETKPPVTIDSEMPKQDAVYEIVVAKGPDKGKSFALEHMVMVLGQRQGDSDERIGQGVLLNDATLPGEIGMFVWQGREGAYGLLASENSMQIMEVERIDQGQRRRIRVDSHSSLLLRVADEIQVGLTTLRVQKIGEPLPDRAPPPPPPPRQQSPVPRPASNTPPGRPTSLRGKSDPLDFGAPARPQAPAKRRPPEPPSRPEPREPEPEVPLWAKGTLVPGSDEQRQQQEQEQTARPRPSGAPPGRAKPADAELLEWGNRPNVDFLLEFTAGPLRGCQISLSRADIERTNRLNAGGPGPRQNEIRLEGPEMTNEAFHLITEGGRFSLCNESESGALVVNRSPLKTGDRVVLMTGDVITLGSTKIRFLEREVVQVLSRYGLQAESGVTADQDRIFPLNRQRLLIGRGKACDVRLSDLEVSRVHLGLALSDGSFSVQHRSETNPTFLNGLSLLPGTVRKIKEGDRIRLSSLTVLRLVRR